MSTQTYTVAQALQTTASGIIVADSPANIAAVVGNSDLVARVSQFTMPGSDVVNAAQAEALSMLGSKFTDGGYTLTLRDSVAAVTASANAQGLTVANQLEVVDNIDNLLTWINNPIVRSANTITLTSDSTLRVAQLLNFESFPHFNATGTSIVLADTAANLLSVTPAEAIPQVTGFAVSINSTVSAADAATLYTKPGFWISVGVTLTVADTLADTNSFVAVHAALAGRTDVALRVADSTTNLTGGMTALTSLINLYPGVTATLGADETVTASTLAGLLAVPHFSTTAGGHTLTVVDTMANLLVVPAAQAALVQAAHLSSSTSATAAQVEQLSQLPGFSAGSGNQLQVIDTMAHLAGMTAAQAALTTGITADDTMSNLVSGWEANLPALPSVTAAAAQLDGGSYTLAQLAPLAGLVDHGTLSVLPSGSDTALQVVDTLQDLASGSAELTALRQAATVDVTPSDDHSIMSAAAAATLATTPGFDPSAYTLAISDTGPAVTAAEAAIFGHGFQAITVTSGTFAGPIADLLDPSLRLEAGASAQLNSDASVNVATLHQLTALPGFSVAGAATLTVQDSAAALAANEAVVSHYAGMVQVAGSALVNAVTADTLATLHDTVGAAHFSFGGNTLTVSDTAANLIDPANSAGIALADSLVVSGDSHVNAAQALEFVALGGKLAPGDSVAVSDNAAALLALVSLSPTDLAHFSSITVTQGDPVTAAQAQAVCMLPNLVADGSLTISDSVADLLQGSGAQPDNWIGELLASHITLTGDTTIDAAQALQLAQLGGRLDNGGHSLILQDTPSALLAAVNTIGPIAAAISETLLADNATPWVVSIAQAAQLSMLPNFQVDAAQGTVADTPDNLLAPINAALISQVPGVSLNGDATVSVQTAQALHALTNFSLGTHDGGVANQLTISDGAGHLAALDMATAAMASAIQLQGSGVASVAQFDAIRTLPNYSDNDKLLLVSDSASNLLTLVGSDVHLASAIMLAPDPSDSLLSADQAQQLATLPGFTPGIAQIGVLDTAADLLHISGTGSTPDDWTGELAAGSVTLSQDGTVSANQAAELALLGSRFHLGTHTLTVSDSAAQLMASANGAGLALATHIQLAGSETLSAAGATQLASIADLDKAGHTVTVADSAANLAFAGYSVGVALADVVQLNAATSLNVSGAEALIGAANFVPNPGAPLTISDSLTNLLSLTSADLPNNNAVLQDTPIALSGDTVATVAQMNALAALPEYAQFSLGGHSLTVVDSGRHLASFTPSGSATPTAYLMTGDARLTAAQADTLAQLGASLDGNTLTIADTPAALLDSANAPGVDLADALVLSGNATVDVATAETLEATPNFSTGGHMLTVSDSVLALLGMDSATQQMASVLALNNSEMVNADTLASLTRLGVKLSLNGHILGVGDTAAHLAALNSMETALTADQVLESNAVVSAAVAAELAALPNFSVNSGISLTVQDSVANLIALTPAVQAIATAEQLAPGANVTITAADAAALAALPHFSNAGATVTVSDSIAALSAPATAGWHSVDTAYEVTDSVSNLVANAGSSLVVNASAVQLLGDTQTNVATLTTLAAIPGFRTDGAVLTIADGPAAIAEHAAQIAAYANGAMVNASTPVTAADTEALAQLNADGLLSFAPGVHLSVEDSYAALTSPANAGGLALAGSVTVLDDIGPLLTAMQASWGGQSPSFDLDADGSVTGAQAAIITAAGGRFSLNGHTLSVQDDAGDTAANAAALAGSGLTVAVTDTAANIAAHAGALIALGSALTSVTVSDTAPIGAADAAGLSGLASKLGGDAVNVADLAGTVDTNRTGLQALGSHLGLVQVTDTAADVAAVAPDLAGFGDHLAVNLTDTQPVDSTVAANLLPLLSHFAAGTHIDVSDTETMLWGRASTLQLLSSIIGTLTISTGNTVAAGTAAVLAPLDSHLGLGVQLLVQDTAADIANWAMGLAQLQTDGRLAGVVAENATAADVVAYTSALTGLHAQIALLDSAAGVSANLDGLQAFRDGGGSIAAASLTDGGSPSITVTLAQATADAGVLADLPYPLSVQDNAATLAADLSGSNSVLLADLGQIATIGASDGGTLSLTADLLLSSNIDDGAGSVLSKYAGTVAVTNAALDQLDTLAAHNLAAGSVAVSTTAAALQSDLTSGASQVLANLGLISTIAADSGTISLTEAQTRATSIDDGSGSVFAKLQGTANLIVTQVAAADAGLMASLPVAPVGIAIEDSAANIQADLSSPTSALAAEHALISGIVATDGGTQTYILDIAGLGRDAAVLPLIDTPFQLTILDSTENLQAELQSGGAVLQANIAQINGISAIDPGTITLTETQVTAPGIENGPDPVFARISGETLVVTDVAAAHAGMILSLPVSPASITVTDSADNVAANLAQLTTDRASITAITVNDGGTLHLTGAELLTAGVDDGAGSVLSMTANLVLDATNVAAAVVDAVASLVIPPATIEVSDTAAGIQADLASGSSGILAHLGTITAIAVSDGGTITLDASQALAGGVDDSSTSAFARLSGASLAVSDVATTQIDDVAALYVAPASIAVIDSSAAIQSDLTGTSAILAHLGLISAIAANDSGTISLTETQARETTIDDGNGSVFSKLSGATLSVTDVLVSDVDTVAHLPVAPVHIVVNDSPTAIAADIELGASSQLLQNQTLIDSVSLDQPGYVMLSSSEITDPTLAGLLAKLPSGSVVAGPVLVSDIGSVLTAVSGLVSSIAVEDAASAIVSDLTTGSNIHDHLGSISSITANEGAISLTEAQVTASGVDDVAGSALTKLSGTTLTVTDAAISDVAALVALPHAPDHIAILDTAGQIGSELASGAPDLLSLLSHIGSITVSDPVNPVQLTSAQVLATGIPDILAKVTGDLAISGVDLASLPAVAVLTGPQLHIAFSDTALNIESDLTSAASCLAQYGALLSDVQASAGTVSLTAQQVLQPGVDNGGGSALAHLSTPLLVSDALVSNLAQLADLTTLPAEIDIADSAANIQADLASGSSYLLNPPATLGPINVIGGTITLSDPEATAAASVLSLVTGTSLAITAVPVADIAAMATLTELPTTLAVLDSAATVQAAAAAGQAIATHAGNIASVAVSDGTLDAATAEAVYTALQAVGVGFDETNLSISDTATGLLSTQSACPAVLSAAHAVALDADALGLSVSSASALLTVLGNQLDGHELTLADSATNLLDPANATTVAAAGSVALDSSTPISAQAATALMAMTNFNAGAMPIAIADTPVNLVDPANATGISAATTVAPDSDCVATADLLAQLAAITSFTNGGHQITLQDTASNVLGASAAALDLASLVDVADSAANVLSNLAALQSAVLDQGHSMAISVSGAVADTPVISIDAATYSTGQAVIDTIDTMGIVCVTGSATEVAALAATLHDDPVVGEVDVSDTPTNILLNLPVLDTLGSKFAGATVSGAVVNAAEVAQLLSIPNLTSGSLTVIDSGAQIAAAIVANGQAAVDFLNNQSVQLNQDSVITATDAQALEGLTSFNKEGYALSVWDSATHLTDSIDGYLSAVSNQSVIDHVYLRAPGGTATVTASTATTLFSIPHFSKSNPDASTNVLTVQDTAAHLGSAYNALSTNGANIDHIVVSGSATVTDALFGELLSLQATAADGVAITVRDTASAIIAGAPAQTSGTQSIAPAAWMLSGSASVDETGIAYLGGLSGFSAGPYTLTLSQDATIGVADATAIASLGSAFRLGTHHLYLPGSIADMAGLSAAAQAIVAPQITDSFSNIAQLLPSSGLLGGTITVNDSEAVTVTQASDFLALLKVGAGSGIPAANVDFAGHVETVTDTLGNIQTLTGASAWAQNAGVHADFSLVVADSVGNLIDPGNLAALSAMAGTTLSGDQTTTAANAETLFAVQSAIHFGLDGHALTVQDTAANLLDPANMDGVGMASVLLLSGSDSVTAAGAETLLSSGTFQINDPATTLTISDSSDALLDGSLLTAMQGWAYASHLQVELANAEVLDAQTAAQLVSLPHFTDTGDLSIQDSASYLLNPNPAILAAEQAATSVTLTGDETVSAATAAHLAAVPHFDLAGATLHLASDDFVDAATLQTIADFGLGFSADGHTLTMTQDAVSLTLNEYSSVQADDVLPNGHALSAIPESLSVTATGGAIVVDGTGVDSAAVTLYDANGVSLATTTASPGFAVTAADAGVNMALTETIGGNAATGESAPVVLLEQSVLEGLVITTDHTSFAASGGANSVQVGTNEYLTLYNAAAAPADPADPVLAYDAASHHLLLEANGQTPVTLVTLGGATTPTHLDASEILVKHQLG